MIISIQKKKGLNCAKFQDHYKEECSLQESSIATEPAIWLGINEPRPFVTVSHAKELGIDTAELGETERLSGWMEYPLPAGTLITGRMHLTQQMVRELLPYLTRFAETGLIEAQIGRELTCA
jgi:hypothetical protein